MPGARSLLMVLLAVVALNAVGGAWYGLAGADDVPRAWLDGSPFDTYTVPSLYLGVVVGGSHLLAFVAHARHHRHAAAASYAAGTILATWILAQLAIIGYVSMLQPVMLAIAALILVSTRLYVAPLGGSHTRDSSQ